MVRVCTQANAVANTLVLATAWRQRRNNTAKAVSSVCVVVLWCALGLGRVELLHPGLEKDVGVLGFGGRLLVEYGQA